MNIQYLKDNEINYMPQTKIQYQDLYRHFTAPKNMPPYGDTIKIPRKLKKKVRSFCGVHWGMSNGVRLWYYLEKENDNYKWFLIKTVIVSNSTATQTK